MEALEFDSKEHTNIMEYLQGKVISFFERHNIIVSWMLVTLVLTGYVIYLILAVFHDAEGAIFLLVVTGLVVLWKVYSWLRSVLGDDIEKHCLEPLRTYWIACWPHIKW